MILLWGVVDHTLRNIKTKHADLHVGDWQVTWEVLELRQRKQVVDRYPTWSQAKSTGDSGGKVELSGKFHGGLGSPRESCGPLAGLFITFFVQITTQSVVSSLYR